MTQRRPLLSVVMPVYNERATIREIIARVLNSSVPDLEIILVDDGSTDGTRELLPSFAADERIRIILQDQNRGKGAALRRGFGEARGRFVIVQDADLEYDPSDYASLLQPLIDDKADVVYGSRFMSGPRRVLYYWHSVANKSLTTLSNMITDLNLTDMETCYKAFRREVLDDLQLCEDRFGIEPEITAKVARLGVRVYEVPIGYAGRTYAEGKKIGVRDAVRAVYCIVRYGVPGRFGRPSTPWRSDAVSEPSTLVSGAGHDVTQDER